ncbi:MAG: hypothetical protein Q4P78_05555 [Rothia sp. (in: high G+C Gram-positive bacteria)]|uniref:hypothetical protein n=1 Tax=Rothia sp. (in: high G+C Gram-positive bacteria) TaxID=1885016 RepID=UPI0026DF2043|nr:hypothetical protein [Rothia sp. (in: high G+C Gram-positive bacteria)]MDO5750653.1 hypothetical protein [Rothia sp. (in: high G+C Gram-positive bacteria)]
MNASQLRRAAALALAGISSLTLTSCAEDTSSQKIKNEHVIAWEDAQVSAPNQIVFTVVEKPGQCVSIRHVQEESKGVVRVALIAGERSGAPDFCANAIRGGRTYTVSTVQPAKNLTIEAIDPSAVPINDN